MHHRLDLNPRDHNIKGLPCHTVYRPSCPCGWVGVPAKRLQTAEGQYTAHLKYVERQARASRRRKGGRRVLPPGPVPCTPEHLLPDVLRSAGT